MLRAAQRRPKRERPAATGSLRAVLGGGFARAQSLSRGRTRVALGLIARPRLSELLADRLVHPVERVTV